MSSLFQISQEFNELYNIANEEQYDLETGELIDNSDTLVELFNEVSSTLDVKLNNTNYVIKELLADAETLKDEAKRLNAKAKAKISKSDNLKGLMLLALKASGEEKLKSDKFTFSVRRSESVNVFNEDEVSREYVKMTRVVDKTKVKKALKEGLEISGCSLSINESLGVR